MDTEWKFKFPLWWRLELVEPLKRAIWEALYNVEDVHTLGRKNPTSVHIEETLGRVSKEICTVITGAFIVL